MKETSYDSGPATPDAPERDWACNRCMYSWNGPDPWCPICRNEATHGKAYAVEDGKGETK